MLCRTTGSHLGMPDEEELRLPFVILATARDGLLTGWTLIEDNPTNRSAHGLD